MESEEEAWDQNRQNGWGYKREEASECKYILYYMLILNYSFSNIIYGITFEINPYLLL